MRIRKHAKISPLLFSSSTLSSESLLQTHICQLNQSPWDVINFSPEHSSSLPPYQVEGENDSFTANGSSLGDSIGAVESVASLKISEERENQTLCCKSDGKGWQCKREAKQGHTLCEHHLVQLRNYNSLIQPKSDKPFVDNQRQRRRARKCRGATSSPHEFYYYSGFGPRWGKKRGTERSAETNVVSTSNDIIKHVAVEAPTKYSSSTLIDNEEFEFVEDEDDDDEDEEDYGEGKKRARKKIKARSLKSLM